MSSGTPSLHELASTHIAGAAIAIPSTPGVEVLFTPEGLTRGTEDLRFMPMVQRLIAFTAEYGGYSNRAAVENAAHPMSVIKVPGAPTGPNGNSIVYGATDQDAVIKASLPGYDDIDTFLGTYWLHRRLSRHGGRVQAPAQLALLHSLDTHQTVIVMERSPGEEIGAYVHPFSGNIAPNESSEAYKTGVKIVKQELRQVIGRTSLARLSDLAVKPHAANILVNGDPRDPDTQFTIIDQALNDTLGTLRAKLARLLEPGKII